MTALGGWLTLAGLGAFHGLNPGMGWLFAVALGLQRRSRLAVLRALPPIALGHALSIGLFAAVVLLARAALPQPALRWGTAMALGGFAVFRLWRKKHLTWVGMQVGFRDLTLWSFLMATAHGAGLMLAPVLLGSSIICGVAGGVGWAGWVNGGIAADSVLSGVAAVAVHTAAHLGVTALLAFLVYEVIGLRVLRQAWFNIDRVWGVSLLVMAGLVALK